MSSAGRCLCVYCKLMSVLLRRNIRRLLQHGYMPGFRRDALEPAPDRWKHRKIIVAKVRDVRIGIERDVGDRIAIRDDVAMLLEMALHHAERAIALLPPILERMLLQLAYASHQRQPEIGGTDIGLDAVLLEEHPLQRFRAVEAIMRPQPCVAGEMPKDRIRLGDKAAGRHFEERNLTARILREELRRSAFALEDVHLFQSVGHTELGEGKPHLVAVARSLH